MTTAERNELAMIKEFTHNDYMIKPMKALGVGDETHTVGLFRNDDKSPILTGKDMDQLRNRLGTILDSGIARKGEIMVHQLNQHIGKALFRVMYWPELHTKTPAVWASLYKEDKPVATMLDEQTLAVVIRAVKRVLC